MAEPDIQIPRATRVVLSPARPRAPDERAAPRFLLAAKSTLSAGAPLPALRLSPSLSSLPTPYRPRLCLFLSSHPLLCASGKEHQIPATLPGLTARDPTHPRRPSCSVDSTFGEELVAARPPPSHVPFPFFPFPQQALALLSMSISEKEDPRLTHSLWPKVSSQSECIFVVIFMMTKPKTYPPTQAAKKSLFRRCRSD